MFRRTTLSVLLLALFAIVPLANAQHFTPVDPTGLPYAIAIEYGKIGNTALKTGDEVAAFDGDLCVGAAIVDGRVTPETALGFTAWEEDSNQGLVGFADGNPIEIRIWRQGQGEFVATANWAAGGNFGDGFGSVASTITGGNPLPVVVDIYPNGDPVIPFGGGYFFYHVMLQNLSQITGQVNVTIQYEIPGGQTYTAAAANITLNGGQTINVNREQYVSQNFPTGDFWYVITVRYGQLTLCSDVMTAEKLGSVVDGATPEFVYDEAVAEIADMGATVNLPDEFGLGNAYPNPFNPTTTLSLALPAAGQVKVAVFNTLGRQVAVLNNSVLDAGNHSMVFDGSRLASGVYFIQATAGAETAIQKVTLMK
ncbi:T9SS type A sorting domain-containing protein [bacterium]|nr:T9SS type A sorting domain-containing protein [bacterium]